MRNRISRALGWVAERKWARLLGFAVVLVLGGLLVARVSPLAAGPHRGLMLKTELLANGNQVASVEPMPASRTDVLTVDQFQTALWWDTLAFVPAYALLLAVGAWLALPLYRLRLLRTKGLSIALGAAIGAWVLDWVENALLAIAVSFGDVRGPDLLFLLAGCTAIAKFLVVMLVLMLVLGGVFSALVTPSWLFDQLERDRRGLVPREPPQEAPTSFLAGKGIALSGGGVRAASLTLGALQELEVEPTGGNRPAHAMGWDQADAVTAVSGGAYMAGAWQLGRRTGQPYSAWRQEALGDGRPGPEERHLMENLGYLASTWPRGREREPGMTGIAQRDLVAERMRNGPTVWVTVIAGFVVNIAVLAATFVVVEVPMVLLLQWLATLGGGCSLLDGQLCVVQQQRFWVPPVFWIGFGCFVASLWLYAGRRSSLRRHIWLLRGLKNLTRASLVLGLLLAVFLVLFPLLIALAARGQWQTGATSLAALAGTAVSIVQTVRSRVPALAPKLGGIAFGVLLVAASSWFATQVLELRFTWDWQWHARVPPTCSAGRPSRLRRKVARWC